MEKSAENVVQNVGAIAETVSIFYNSIVRQVPKDVALVLTQHFMDLTIARKPVPGNVAAAAVAAAQAAEARRRALEQQKQTQQAQQTPQETQPVQQDKPHEELPQPEDGAAKG